MQFNAGIFCAFLFERPEFSSCWLPDLHIGCPADSVLDVNSAYESGAKGENQFTRETP